MKIKKLLIFVILFSTSTYSSVPTVEGLLRNGNNPDITGNWVIANMRIDEVQNEEILNRIKVSDQEIGPEQMMMNKKSAPLFLKMIFSLENERRPDLLQLNYNNGQMKSDSLSNVIYFPNVIKKIEDDVNIETSVFYSMLMMLLLNDDRGMDTLVKRNSPDFKSNAELINGEKLGLMYEYKKYLQAIKSNPAKKKEITSPLKPADEDGKAKVSRIMAANMYHDSANVKMVRMDGTFYWKVQLENMEAIFYNDTHRLKAIKVKGKNGYFVANCGDYGTFEGIHEFPKTIYVKDMRERVFRIKMLTMKNPSNKGEKLYERVKQFQEEELASRKTRTPPAGEPLTDLFIYQ